MSEVIPKPNMRGMHMNYLKRGLVNSFILAIAAGISFKLLVMDPRRRRYEEFYRTYDAAAVEKRMDEAGLLMSTKNFKG